MSEIKLTLDALCDLLGSLFDSDSNSNLKPIFFKHAKYNKTDAGTIPVFWNMLYKMIPIAIKENNVNKIQKVKLFFASLNYQDLEFYSLSEDMNSGSRILLLAFSWLLAKENNCIVNAIKKKIIKSVLSEEFATVSNLLENEEHVINLNNIQEYQNYILMFIGKIHNNLKLVAEYTEKNVQLMSKIHKETDLKNMHLSIAEVYMLKNPGKLDLYLQEITKISNLLNRYNKWETREKNYWKWMSSVIHINANDTGNSIEKNVLKEFFKLLQTHVKEILSENNEKPAQINRQNAFLRCVQSQDAKQIFEGANSIINLEIMTQINVRNICEFLGTVL